MNLSQLMLLAIISAPVVSSSTLVAQESPAAAQGLPPEAKQAVAEYDAQVVAIQKKAELEIEAVRKRAEQEILAAREECRKALKVVQDTYTKAGKLDEAVAIRDRSATLQITAKVLADPGTLVGYKNHIGEVLYFEVVGTNSGSIYGNGVYTTDSNLGMAAVHSGALKTNQAGVVKVTILPGQEKYESAGRNGITSSSWGEYPASFKVEPAYSIQHGKPADPK